MPSKGIKEQLPFHCSVAPGAESLHHTGGPLSYPRHAGIKETWEGTGKLHHSEKIGKNPYSVLGRGLKYWTRKF